MSKVTVTEKDRELISVLSENARENTAAIARRLGLSRSTVQAKIDRLEEGGVIRGYGVRLSDEYRKGLVRAHILVTIAPKTLNRITGELGELPEVQAVYSVSGNFDLIVEVAAESISELDRVIDLIGEIKGVERTLSSVILSTRIERQA